LHRFNPALEFLLIDLNTIDPEALQGVGNACAVFFQMALVSDSRALPALAAVFDPGSAR